MEREEINITTYCTFKNIRKNIHAYNSRRYTQHIHIHIHIHINIHIYSHTHIHMHVCIKQNSLTASDESLLIGENAASHMLGHLSHKNGFRVNPERDLSCV